MVPNIHTDVQEAVDHHACDWKASFEQSHLSNADVIQLCLKHNRRFNEVRKGTKVLKMIATEIGKGSGFLSNIYKIEVQFENGLWYSFILKIPMLSAFDVMMGDIGDKMEPDAASTVEDIVEGHNVECEFYARFPRIRNCPTPEVYLAQKIYNDQKGVLIMENLADRGITLGFYGSASAEQIMQVARALANLHYNANAPSHAAWWKKESEVRNMRTKQSFHEFMLGLYGLTYNYEETRTVADGLMPVLNKEFVSYALVDKPREYNATSMVHGDLQPNNIMFRRKKDGSVSDDLLSFIDFQLIFAGNPTMDLARFIIQCADGNVRKHAEKAMYDAYYEEFRRLYAKCTQLPPFTYENGLELFHLAICQQTIEMMVIAPFIDESNKRTGVEIDDKKRKITLNRARYSAERAMELINMYGLQRFSKFTKFERK